MTRRASEVKIPLLRSRSAQKAENSPASGECVLLQRRRRTPTFKVMPGRVDFFVRKSIFLQLRCNRAPPGFELLLKRDYGFGGLADEVGKAQMEQGDENVG